MENRQFRSDVGNIYVGIAGLPADDEIVAAIKVVEGEAMTREQAIKAAKSAGVYEEQIDAAIREGYIEVAEAFLDEPLLYVPEHDSEEQVKKAISEWIAVKNCETVMEEAIRNRRLFDTKGQNMLDFLQTYDDYRLKFWTPLTFYQTLTNLYEKGVFNGTELEPLMSVVEEAKSTIVDELDIELADAKKLVDLNLLSPWTGRQAFTSTASALILTTFLGRSAWIMLFSSREILANSAGTRRNFWRKKVF